MAKVRNLLPRRRVVSLDALKGKERPGRPLGGGKVHPGGFDYQTVTFGPHRGQGMRRAGPKDQMPDTVELPKGGEESSAIVEGIRQGTFRLMSPTAKPKK